LEANADGEGYPQRRQQGNKEHGSDG
jgi:hypothetical protein